LTKHLAFKAVRGFGQPLRAVLIADIFRLFQALTDRAGTWPETTMLMDQLNLALCGW
jgi:hypothetical protein